MNIPILNRANVPTPPAGEVYLFLDADNSNILSYKDSNCNFFVYSSGSNLVITNTGVDECLCDIVKELSCQFGKSVARGITTMADFQSWWENINIYRNHVVDPLTGSYTDSISSTPTLLLTVATTNALCNGSATGTATTGVTGGTAPYTISWGASNPAALAAGAHTVTVTDSNSRTITRQIVITQPAALAIVVATTGATGIADGTATANVTGGTAPYTYEWRDNGGTPIGQTTRTATALLSGIYQVYVLDTNGCAINENSVEILDVA